MKWPAPVPNSCGRPAVIPELLPQGFTGLTAVAILVDESGAVVESRITNSSGQPALDQALLAAARACKFIPGTRANVPSALPTVWVYRWGTPPDSTSTRIVAPYPLPRRPATVPTIDAICPTRATPHYPMAAVRREATGVVTVKAKVANGVVAEVLEISGPEVFRPSVIAALSQYKCTPAAESIVAAQSFTFRLETVAPAASSPQ